MVRSRDLVTMIRRRAGLTEGELATRAGVARETIARWEHGSREPSVAALAGLARAAGLDLSVSLVTADDSLAPLAADQLRRAPLDRLRSLLPEAEALACEGALRTIGRLAPRSVVIGPVADVLLGSPQRPAGPEVDVTVAPATTLAFTEALLDMGAWPDETGRVGVQRWTPLPGGGALRLVTTPAGTSGYRDLSRDAETIALPAAGSRTPEVLVRVAAPLDLLRIAESSADGRVRRPGLLAVLEARAQPSSAAAAA